MEQIKITYDGTTLTGYEQFKELKEITKVVVLSTLNRHVGEGSKAMYALSEELLIQKIKEAYAEHNKKHEITITIEDEEGCYLDISCTGPALCVMLQKLARLELANTRGEE